MADARSAAAAPHAGAAVASRLLAPFVYVVSGLGALTIADALWRLPATPRPLDWLLLSAMAVAAGAFPLRVPGVAADMSVSDTFLYTTVVLFGPAPAIVAVALDGVVISWRRAYPLSRLLFNAANPALAIWVAGRVCSALTGIEPMHAAPSVDSWTLAMTLAAIAAVHFVVNSGLTATAAALERCESPWRLWRRHFGVFALTYTAASSAALFMVLLTRLWGVAALCALVPIVAVVHMALGARFGRLADAEQHIKAVDRLYMSTIEAMSTAIEAKDGVTSSHTRRVQAFCAALAQRMGILDPNMLRALQAASLLHDTGKLAIPEHILNKPGKLTPAEFEIMKRHVDVGADILAAIEFPYPVVPIVRAHHENWDGSGYPRGLRGDAIPIGARILSVADCYDALTSDRPYRAAMTTEQAVSIILERRGTMYDPEVVDVFLAALPFLKSEVEQQPHLAAVVQSMHQAASLDKPAPTAHAAGSKPAA